MVYKQNVLGALAAPGSEKNYKFIYIKHMLDRTKAVYDRLPVETSATVIDSLRDEVVGYVDDEAEKTNMLARAKALEDTIIGEFRKEGTEIDGKARTEAKRIAAVRCVGWVLKYFDSAWNWSRKRGVLIAGPFGDGRRRFLPLSLLPPDGTYVHKETKVEVVFNLNALLLNNKDDDIYDQARNDHDEAPEEEGVEYVNGPNQTQNST